MGGYINSGEDHSTLEFQTGMGLENRFGVQPVPEKGSGYYMNEGGFEWVYVNIQTVVAMMTDVCVVERGGGGDGTRPLVPSPLHNT